VASTGRGAGTGAAYIETLQIEGTSGLGELHTIEKVIQSGTAGVLVLAVLADAETLQIELLVKPQINRTLPQDAIGARRSRRLALLTIVHIR
jgi:hypothetical protein